MSPGDTPGDLHSFSFLVSLRTRHLEVVDERENERARGRHARGEGAPAWKVTENRFNSHSVSADISNWLRGSRGKKLPHGGRNCQSIVYGPRITPLAPETTKLYTVERSSGLAGHFNLV